MENEYVSAIDSSLTLNYLQYHTENQYLERKGLYEQQIAPAKIANEIIGMLNAGGGVLVLGIADDGVITDLQELDEKVLNRYRLICNDLIAPPANVQLEEITLPTGELIFIYHIAIDAERMFCRSDNEDVYVRIADQNKGPLSREQVRVLEYDKEIRKYEEEIRPEFDWESIDIDTVEWYKNHLRYEGTYQELLVARKLAKQTDDGVLITNSGVLLFAADPDGYITNAKVRYVRFNGIEALGGQDHNVIKDEEFLGNIPTQIEALKEFIYASLRDYYYLDIEIGKFVKISEYPEDAWFEGVVNALCHRSYNVQGNCVYVKHFDDRLEISNSGPLPAQVTIENIRTERYARNPRIARVLSEFGYVRELNEGVPRIYSSMAKSMLSEPEYSVTNNTVKLSLRNKVSGHNNAISDRVMKLIEMSWVNWNESQKKIVVYMFENNHATLAQLTEELQITDNAVRGYLNSLCGQNVLERNTDKIRDLHAMYTFKKSSGRSKQS